uniref:Transmembrane protein n=1 Tax=Chromera velia CCMP2878 TaxID=1169474 RepID=A0A0G4I5K7_9ALVE|eukprot:Cvel_11201.t1-p1 / transcript=Cvel_11201.t1 / gene=Cvel_11201 / organism=Chromera_velia_CCMP2878 / gene_product=hypothetical protein / transcript_product=hypothetical protein / location=Cvel_scaffold696:20261-34364(-) / protein_length=884 / sequence_SO=supercontig / SO=protein_coding / is_pseudo=false
MSSTHIPEGRRPSVTEVESRKALPPLRWLTSPDRSGVSLVGPSGSAQNKNKGQADSSNEAKFPWCLMVWRTFLLTLFPCLLGIAWVSIPLKGLDHPWNEQWGYYFGFLPIFRIMIGLLPGTWMPTLLLEKTTWLCLVIPCLTGMIIGPGLTVLIAWARNDVNVPAHSMLIGIPVYGIQCFSVVLAFPHWYSKYVVGPRRRVWLLRTMGPLFAPVLWLLAVAYTFAIVSAQQSRRRTVRWLASALILGYPLYGRYLLVDTVRAVIRRARKPAEIPSTMLPEMVVTMYLSILFPRTTLWLFLAVVAVRAAQMLLLNVVLVKYLDSKAKAELRNINLLAMPGQAFERLMTIKDESEESQEGKENCEGEGGPDRENFNDTVLQRSAVVDPFDPADLEANETFRGFGRTNSELGQSCIVPVRPAGILRARTGGVVNPEDDLAFSCRLKENAQLEKENLKLSTGLRERRTSRDSGRSLSDGVTAEDMDGSVSASGASPVPAPSPLSGFRPSPGIRQNVERQRERGGPLSRGESSSSSASAGRVRESGGAAVRDRSRIPGIGPGFFQTAAEHGAGLVECESEAPPAPPDSVDMQGEGEEMHETGERGETFGAGVRFDAAAEEEKEGEERENQGAAASGVGAIGEREKRQTSYRENRYHSSCLKPPTPSVATLSASSNKEFNKSAGREKPSGGSVFGFRMHNLWARTPDPGDAATAVGGTGEPSRDRTERRRRSMECVDKLAPYVKGSLNRRYEGNFHPQGAENIVTTTGILIVKAYTEVLGPLIVWILIYWQRNWSPTGDFYRSFVDMSEENFEQFTLLVLLNSVIMLIVTAVTLAIVYRLLPVRLSHILYRLLRDDFSFYVMLGGCVIAPVYPIVLLTPHAKFPFQVTEL